MNIEKIISALNDKDYGYVYNKLDEKFKNNKFNNIDSFKEYMNNVVFDSNKAEYLNFSEEGNTYIYNIKIKSANEEVNESKSVTIIMKLLEGTDFVMSFNVE